MELRDEALVLASAPHGENGAIVRFLSFANGLRAGYVPGARSRARRSALQPGTRVALTLRQWAEGQLPTAAVEALSMPTLLAFDSQAMLALAWVSLLLSDTLYEGVPHVRLAEGFAALVSGFDAGMSRVETRAAVARFELLLLEEEGLGLDLAQCALGGDAADLAFVSPKTGRAVSRARAEGQSWKAHLLPLPAFLIGRGAPDDASARSALELSGHFIARHWFASRPRLATARALFTGTSEERLAAGAPLSRKAE